MSSQHSYYDVAPAEAVAAGYSPDDAQQRPDGEPFGDLLNALDPALTALGFAPAIIGSTRATFTRGDETIVVHMPTGTPSATGGTLDGHGNTGLPHLSGDSDRGCQCRDDLSGTGSSRHPLSVLDDCGQPMPSFSGSQDDFLIQPDNRHFGPDTIDPGD